MRVALVMLALVAGCAMKVSGFVSDAANGHPIGGARVRIEDRICYTSAVGTYLLKVHKKPTATADVAAPGYVASTVTCQTPGKHPVCDVVLTPIHGAAPQ